MKITFLGSGSAFCMDNYQSNMIIESNGKKMLFDCGGDIRWALKEKELSALDIDAVYVSHLHADHVGGMEYIAFVNYFVKTLKSGFKPTLYGHGRLLNDLWNRTLRGGLASIQMLDASLDTYFDVCKVGDSKTFEFAGTSFKLVQSIHIIADTSIVRSYGLMFNSINSTEGPGKKVFITSDTQYAPAQIKDFIGASDIVFHDCETAPYASGVHAHYNDLKTLAPELKSKMWLYHYNGNDGLPDAQEDGFRGFVAKGQEFEL